MPVAGIVVALFAAAASVSATALTAGVLAGTTARFTSACSICPRSRGAVITAVVLGVVISKRAIHYLPLAGMVFLAAGIAVFRIEVPSSKALTLIGSGLTGIGLGATVAPALFVAGFSLPSASLQRVFAIVELMRAVAAFMIAPIFVHFAVTVGGSLDAGTGIALWIGLGLAIGGAVIGVAIYALGGARPQTPDLERFLAGEAPAWYSPPLLARVRSGVAGRTPGDRKRRLTWRRLTPRVPDCVAPPARCCSPTTAPSWRRYAIEQAGRQLAPGREALVVCVWQPVDVGFMPVEAAASGRGRGHRGADGGRGDRRARSVAGRARRDFERRSVAIEAAPTWKGIVEVAEEHEGEPDRARLPPAHGHSGHLLGSVAAAVVAHSQRSVLVVHRRS